MVDPFRSTYRELTDQEKQILQDVKAKAKNLYEILDNLYPSREKSLSITKLEESIMWAVKGITS